MEKIDSKEKDTKVSQKLPLFSFDFDGVICRPPLGQNRVLGRELHDDELPESIRLVDGPAKGLRRKSYLQLRGLVETVKYLGRVPMPHAREGLICLSELRRMVIITGRSYLAKQIVEAWLKKYDMSHFFEGIYPNNTNLGTRLYKLHTLQNMGISEHADDDGAISYYLARRGIQIYLRDWERNAGLPYPESVVHFQNIAQIADDIEARDQLLKRGDLTP